MLKVVLGWVNDEPVSLAIDNGYCCKESLGKLPGNVTVEGAFKSNSVLYAPLGTQSRTRKGRPASRGERLGSVDELIKSNRFAWQRLTVKLDGKATTMRVKTFRAMWPHVCPKRVLRVVLVECTKGERRYRGFFSTDETKDAVQVLEDYSGRWSTEVTFHDGKQLLGLTESSARKPAAVERVLPFVGLTFGTLVLWYEQHAKDSAFARWPVRPWYPHKKGDSFEDIMRAARRVLGKAEIAEMLSFDLSLRETGSLQEQAFHGAA